MSDKKDTKNEKKPDPKTKERTVNPMTMVPDEFKVSRNAVPTKKEKLIKKLFGF